MLEVKAEIYKTIIEYKESLEQADFILNFRSWSKLNVILEI
ncbi:MAG: hypothetical protein ACTSU4_13365 [Promethearchaeota archaeon]